MSSSLPERCIFFLSHRMATMHKLCRTWSPCIMHVKLSAADKRDTTETTGCVYEISCKNCDFTYVGETGRSLATRLKEHRTEVEKITKKIHTRATRLSLISDQHKSAIADHVASTNHIIDWEDPKILHRESDKFTRWVRESIWIRRRGNKAMNNEGGAAYNLNHVYDHIIQKSRNTSPGCTNHHTWSRDQPSRSRNVVAQMWVTGYVFIRTFFTSVQLSLIFWQLV